MYSYKLAIVAILALAIGSATAIAKSTETTETDIASIYLDVQKKPVDVETDDENPCAEALELGVDCSK